MNTKLKFIHVAPYVWESLCILPRTGWVKRNVMKPETVAEHICSLKVLAVNLLQQIPELSSAEKQRVLDMIEIHDWPEYHSKLGDIPTPELGMNGYMTKKEKKEFEDIVMLDVCRSLGQVGFEILFLWQEFVDQNTIVSNLVHQLDKLQPILLAIHYEERGECPGIAQEFFDYGHQQIVHPVLVEHLNISVRATYTVKT